MRVLVACERSGRVRDAFLAKGHDAWSCDLFPSEAGGPHMVGDVLDKLGLGWDMMIAHPPCTHLAVSGARWFSAKRQQQREALDFVRHLLAAPIPRVCIENPVSILSTVFREPDQVIQPWQFGHPEAKATCLWLVNLPVLFPTRVLALPECGYWQNQTPSRQNKLGPSHERTALRAKTYEGVATAMAEQWGDENQLPLILF